MILVCIIHINYVIEILNKYYLYEINLSNNYSNTVLYHLPNSSIRSMCQGPPLFHFNRLL